MEAKGESTSRQMRLDAARMAELVFTTHRTPHKRVCFLATPEALANSDTGGGSNESEDARGYATVDVDRIRASVRAHGARRARAPAQGHRAAARQGRREPLQRPTPGAKFARYCDYEGFYAKAGFTVTRTSCTLWRSDGGRGGGSGSVVQSIVEAAVHSAVARLGFLRDCIHASASSGGARSLSQLRRPGPESEGPSPE